MAFSRVLIYISLLPIVFIAFTTSCTQSSEAVHEKAKRNTFLADPTIFYHDGTYHLYGTGSRQGFRIYVSDDLQTWEIPAAADNGLALTKGEAFGTRGFWAPQVFSHQGKFYMAYTANESIAIAKSESPLGPFVQQEKQPLAAPVKQIDPFIFLDNGKKYLYHVRVANGGNRIYVAELEDDFSAIKQETLTECITATEPWENIEQAEWTVTEGPTVLKHDGLYYMIYSTNHFRSKNYAVGYAVSDNPYGPWKKYEGNPILRREDVGYNGTGHGDIFYDKDQNMYYVFHTHNSDSTVGPRRTAVIKAEFKEANPDRLVFDEDSFQFLETEIKQ